MRIFSSDIGKKLKNIYIPKLIANGYTPKDSKKIFKILLKSAKKESRLQGTSNLPKNYGSFLLKERLSNVETRTIVEDLRKDGVRDEDMRWWWNMDDLERRIIEKIDDDIIIVNFINNCKEGMSEEEAAKNVRKFYPMYGDLKETSKPIGNDRSLPEELRNRINAYIEKRAKTDPEEYKKEIEKSTTFNALVRGEIKKGNI